MRARMPVQTCVGETFQKRQVKRCIVAKSTPTILTMRIRVGRMSSMSTITLVLGWGWGWWGGGWARRRWICCEAEQKQEMRQRCGLSPSRTTADLICRWYDKNHTNEKITSIAFANWMSQHLHRIWRVRAFKAEAESFCSEISCRKMAEIEQPLRYKTEMNRMDSTVFQGSLLQWCRRYSQARRLIPKAHSLETGWLQSKITWRFWLLSKCEEAWRCAMFWWLEWPAASQLC